VTTIDNSDYILYQNVSYEGIACTIIGGRGREREKSASRRRSPRSRKTTSN